MESEDSCSRLQMSCWFHRDQCHERLVGKKFWRALDTYSGDHGKVALEGDDWDLALGI